MLEALVGFPTVSETPTSSCQFVADYLRRARRRTHAGGQRLRAKANLYATIGPEVPAASCCPGTPTWCPWTARTGTPTRSASSNATAAARPRYLRHEGFIAIALALVPEMQACAIPMHFALSYDEEVGCLGAPRLIEAITANLPRHGRSSSASPPRCAW
jgi:acetylornithine deacetylase